MIGYLQETESKIVFSVPYTEKNENETVGLKSGLYLFSLSENKLVKSALQTIRDTTDKKIADRSRNLLQLIQKIVASLQHLSFDVAYLPPFTAVNVEDNSVLIEWTFKDFRIGFTIEDNEEDSGWYLVSNRKLGEILASGSIANIDLEKHLLWLLNFVFAYS
jgi:hypothetical protein